MTPFLLPFLQQIEETRKALEEADREELASAFEVRRVVKNWTKRSSRAR